MSSLIPVREVRKDGKHTWWEYTCECGQTKTIRRDSVVSGSTISCGCKRLVKSTTHGMTSSPEYQSWIGIKARCSNPELKDYAGRGITICPEWVSSFETFYKDMGPKPTGDYSVERKDNSLGYFPDNCIWATRTVQNRNRRTTRIATIGGVAKPLAEWCEILNVRYRIIISRVLRGWDEVTALQTPTSKRKQMWK